MNSPLPVLARLAGNLARRMTGRPQRCAGPRLVICAYHGLVSAPLEIPDWCFLDVASFRKQVEFLRRHFELMSLGEAVMRLAEGELDRPAAVITFDDGFRSVHDLAFPVLRELNAPATVFLVTGLVDTDDTVWFCRINQAVTESHRNVLAWDGTQFDLGSVGAKTAASASIQDRLKRFPQARLIEEVEWIVRELGGDPGRPVGQDSPFRILEREMIATMATSGLVEFGAHTVSHAILRPLTAPERRVEIGASLAAVAQVTGQPCDLFAYPNGRPTDYDNDTIRLLRELEVRAAVTTIEGVNVPSTPALELKRIGIGPDTTLRDFAAALQVPDVASERRPM